MRNLHSTLHLQHHRHTGRMLHHRHTSYRGLAVVLLVSSVFLVILTTLARSAADTLSGDLTVSAQIMAPVPNQAPVITDPADGSTTGQMTRTVSGTCPVITPGVIVAVLVNGASGGSTPCDTDGTFTVNVPLVQGLNTLIAQVYTITYQAGLSSVPVHITYTPGDHDDNSGSTGGSDNSSGDTGGTNYTPQSAASGSNGNGSSDNGLVSGYSLATGTGNGATYPEGAPLVISMTNPFIIFGPELDAVWQGSISGGEPDYKVTIYWGDGAHSSYTLTAGGDQSFSHHYTSMEPHTINMYVNDSTGQHLERQYAAVTPYVPPSGIYGGTKSNAGSSGSGLGGFTMVGLYGAYLTVLAGFGALWAHSHRHRQFAYAKVPVRHAHVRGRR